MNKKFYPKGTIIAALDVGSHKNACLIGRIVDEQGEVEVLGVGYQSSRGVKNGLISNLDAADNAIRKTVHSAESMAAEAMKGYPLRDVIINVPGTQSVSDVTNVTIELADDIVDEQDIKKAIVRAQDQSSSSDVEMVHAIPFGYSLDGKVGIQDPVGMSGDVLNLEIHMVAGSVKSLKNTALCVEKSHLDVISLCSSSYASGLSCLVEDEMDLGCVLIDMGAGSTTYSIFQQGVMMYSGSIPIGGWHVSNDIAKGLTCSFKDAERIKTLYGSAMMMSHDDAELIDVPQIGDIDQSEKNHIPRSLLIGIIQPRLEEILEMIRDELQPFNDRYALGKRVVLTGGASQLPNVRDLAQLILEKQVRLGRPIHFHNLPDAAAGPAFSTVTGLLTYFATRQHEAPAEINASVDSEGLWQRVKTWWKENW
jgi:cell division protein FtsA